MSGLSGVIPLWWACIGLGDEEEVVRLDRKLKGVIMALHSSVEEQLPSKSVVKGCKNPFSKNHVGLRPLDWALQSWGDCSWWMRSV